MTRDEQQADVLAAGAQFADDLDERGFFALPRGGTEEHDHARVGAEAEVGAETRAFFGGHRRVARDVELDVARDRRVEAEHPEAARVFFAARGDLPEVSENVMGKFPEALVTREGFVGDAPVDEIGGHAAGARLGEMLRPEFAFDQDDHVGSDAAPGEGAAGPEVGREDTDGLGHVGVSFLSQTVARARGGGQDDLRLPGGLQLAEEGADGLDFAHGDRLEPETAFSRGLRALGGEEAEPLAET